MATPRYSVESAGGNDGSSPRPVDELHHQPAPAQPLLQQPPRLLPRQTHLGHLRRILHIHWQLGGKEDHFSNGTFFFC